MPGWPTPCESNERYFVKNSTTKLILIKILSKDDIIQCVVNWKGSSSFDRWRQMFIVGQIVGSKSSRGILNNNPAILFNDPSSARVRDNDGERRERKRNRFYGDRNYAPGWNLVRWNAKRLLQLLSPPSVYFRAFCLHWRKFFDEGGAIFTFPPGS